MLKFFFYASLFLCTSSAWTQKVDKKPASAWVSSLSPNYQSSTQETGAYRYLLLDYQDNVITEERFAHFAIELKNSEGIQEFSDISVNYDPTFQKLTFHQISVVRDGKKSDKLSNAEINTFQRESNLERSLYDGSITAVINLSDIRKGDIIEYSYTLKGYNPINKGNYATMIYQQYTSPVDRIHHKIVYHTKHPLFFKKINGADDPSKTTKKGITELVWDTDGTDYFVYDVNTPYWTDLQKRISISSFKDWEDVVNLSLPLYQNAEHQFPLPEDVRITSQNKEEKIIKLIQFVQDEVRYLGFESGIGAYKPNHPKKVLNQRYGDCKDKSLLLVNLLKREGINAYPFLVNTNLRNSIHNLRPSHSAFDHCIVTFEHDDQTYFVDPTMTGQGGNLDNLSFPKYGAGLTIKQGENQLTQIPEGRVTSTINIEETITLDSIGGEAIFLIESSYRGSRADQMRDFFKSNTKETINKEFVNYYSSIYPSIRSFQEVKITDKNRNGHNEIIIEEFYEIPEFWTKDESTGLFICETEPLVLESTLEYPNSPKRTMDYYIGEPFGFNQKTTITLPEFWNIPPTSYDVNKDAFAYTSSTRSVGRTIEIKHGYTLKKNTIEAHEVSNFLKEHEKITSQIGYQLSHSGKAGSAVSSNVNWISILISLLVIGIGLFFSKRIYEEYNPETESNSSYRQKKLGGWMVIPLIGLLLTPIFLVVTLAENAYYDAGVWSAFYDGGYDNATSLTLITGFELIYNLLFLIFTLLLIILFFKKRTSLPKLIVIFYGLNVLVPLLELLFVTPLLPAELRYLGDGPAAYKEIGRSIVGAAIWIPYFRISERVKDTFVNTYGEMETQLTTNTK